MSLRKQWQLMAGPFLGVCFKLIKIFQKGIRLALQNSSSLCSASPFPSQARCQGRSQQAISY